MVYLTGFHAIEERIKSGAAGGAACGPLLVAKSGPRAKKIEALAVENKIRLERVGTFELDNLAPDNRGIALQVDDDSGKSDISLEEFLSNLEEKQQKNALVLILDEITDPHNYGAILRSCDQFGVDLVLGRNRRSAKNAAVISQTSAGAVSWVAQADTPNLVRAIDELKEAGFWIYGGEMEATPIHKIDLKGRIAFVLGSEGSGIGRLLRERCDAMTGIPSIGRIDSLNVSVAAGILLYEVHRQRTV